MVTVTKLQRTDGYAIFAHQQNKGTTLVVTFDEIKSKIGRSGFGTDWVLKQGWDNIYVSQRRRTQYQHLSRDEFAEAVAPIAEQYDRVVCYGSSLGGYAAVYFGGALKCQIVAASPRLSNHPIINAPRFRDIPLLHPTSLPAPVSATPPIVIFDPVVLRDARFLFQYIGPRYPEIHLSPLPGVGHLVLNAMARAGVITTVLRKIIGGETTSIPAWATQRILDVDDAAVESEDTDAVLPDPASAVSLTR